MFNKVRIALNDHTCHDAFHFRTSSADAMLGCCVVWGFSCKLDPWCVDGSHMISQYVMSLITWSRGCELGQLNDSMIL